MDAPLYTLFGGIGGAALTLVATWWKDRRKRKRVLFLDSVQAFKLPAVLTEIEGTQHPLMVSLGGIAYDNLARKTAKITNTGKEIIPACQLVVQYPKDTQVLSVSAETQPRDIQPTWAKRQSKEADEYEFIIPTLEPNDTFEASILYNGKGHLLSIIRGTENTLVTTEPVITNRLRSIERYMNVVALGSVIAIVMTALSVSRIGKETQRQWNETYSAAEKAHKDSLRKLEATVEELKRNAEKTKKEAETKQDQR
jgi:hypothetical protein